MKTDFQLWIDGRLDVVDWDSKGNAKCICPFHPPTKKASLYVNRWTGLWHCWVRSCPASAGGNMRSLHKRIHALPQPVGPQKHLADTLTWKEARTKPQVSAPSPAPADPTPGAHPPWVHNEVARIRKEVEVHKVGAKVARRLKIEFEAQHGPWDWDFEFPRLVLRRKVSK